MPRFDGYVFSKLHLIGSKSEGPIYFLQQWDYTELAVVKKTMPWEQDPALHEARKVTIHGTFDKDGIHYDKVLELQPPEPEVQKAREEAKLNVDLRLGVDVLWVNKMPPTQSPEQQSMDLTLLVQWPHRSIWRGISPTSQIYDFSIEREEKTIWQWSRGRMFLMVVTPVVIPGGDPVEFPEVWRFDPNQIESEGTYTARATFIASGQEVSKDFEVKFAQ